MKIVVLDGYAAKGEDLDFDFLSAYGEVDYFDRTSPEDVLDRIVDADVVLLNKVALTRDILRECKHLKLVSVLATGYNVVDVKAARELGITVCNVPDRKSVV